MKRKITSLAVILFIIVCFMSGCGISGSSKKVSPSQKQMPKIEKVRSICELATLECYYHNVAKSVKYKQDGITHIGEKDRKFWIEYTGTVKLGIDMSRVNMDLDGNNVTISIPSAEVLEISVDEASYNEDSYFIDSDNWWNENKITAEDTTEAVKTAQEKMKQAAMEDSALLLKAQERAKKLIENYLQQMEESVKNASGEKDAEKYKYNIVWKYIDEEKGD